MRYTDLEDQVDSLPNDLLDTDEKGVTDINKYSEINQRLVYAESLRNRKLETLKRF